MIIILKPKDCAAFLSNSCFWLLLSVVLFFLSVSSKVNFALQRLTFSFGSHLCCVFVFHFIDFFSCISFVSHSILSSSFSPNFLFFPPNFLDGFFIYVYSSFLVYCSKL